MVVLTVQAVAAVLVLLLATTIGPVTISADMYDEDDSATVTLLLVVLRLTVVITEV
jgi:hypothetical protein